MAAPPTVAVASARRNAYDDHGRRQFMAADLAEKTDRYERLLDEAIAVAEPAPPGDTPLAAAARDCLEMAGSYLQDGRHFRANDDTANALAAFAYGHGWLDAGARVGLLSVPRDGVRFPV